MGEAAVNLWNSLVRGVYLEFIWVFYDLKIIDLVYQVIDNGQRSLEPSIRHDLHYNSTLRPTDFV